MTVADLARRSKATLTSAKNLGRGSVGSLVAAIAGHRVRVEAARARAGIGFLEGWKALLQDHEAVPRMVLTLRAGLGGRAEKLQAIGELLGVTRERIRQIEARTIEDLRQERLFLEEARGRFDAALVRGAVAVDDLVAEAWWAGVDAVPDALDFFGERLLDGAARVIEVDDRVLLARCTREAFDEAWASLKREAFAVPLPAPFARFEELVGPTATRVGEALAAVLFDRLQGSLHVDRIGDERSVVVVGDSSAAAILGLLRASPTPLPVDQVRAEAGRAVLPDEVLYFAGGRIGLAKHFPDFDHWMEVLVPPAVELMAREGPDRQWLARDLLGEIREAHDVPSWLGDWHMSSLLRRSGKVRYLGRMRVALPDAAGSEERLQFHAGIVAILRASGAPMRHDDLVARLRAKTSTTELSLAHAFRRPPVFRIDEDRFGLLDRDLEGGQAALVEALDHVAVVLERRQRGFGAGPLRVEIGRLSAAHASWTADTCLSVCRTDARFRLSQAGAVGLAVWDDVRVPTRLALARQCLEEAGGRVSVEAIEQRIEAHYGERPPRASIAGMANQLGAALRGEWVEGSGGGEGGGCG